MAASSSTWCACTNALTSAASMGEGAPVLGWVYRAIALHTAANDPDVVLCKLETASRAAKYVYAGVCVAMEAAG